MADGKKQKALAAVFEHCRNKKELVFDNELVKQIVPKYGFKNPFDLTKIDSSDKLPQNMQKANYGLIHLGKGRHQFVKGRKKIFHTLEKVRESKCWEYQRSLLNEADASEANLLSVAVNQGILDDFLGEVFPKKFKNNRKVYLPRRTKISLEYTIGKTKIIADKVQMEIDLTIESDGQIVNFEAKNQIAKDFAIYQIYHPYAYYTQFLHKRKNQNVDYKVSSCYVLYQKEKRKLRLYLYDFTRPQDMTSIKLIKNREYILKGR